MAQKKKPTVSTKIQLLVATGTVLLLAAFGLFVAWLDTNTSDAGSFHVISFNDVTLKGKPVCLSHKGTGSHTMECAVGIQTASGSAYIIKGTTLLLTDTSTEVTGRLVAPSPADAYNSSGTLIVE